MTAQESFPWTTTEHCERYCQLVKAQQRLLRSAWDDLELTADIQANELKATANQAEGVWREALRQVENQRATVREQIDDAQSRIEKLKSELSDETFSEPEVGEVPRITSLGFFVHSSVLCFRISTLDLVNEIPVINPND